MVLRLRQLGLNEDIFYPTNVNKIITLSHRSGRQPKTYVKPEAAVTVFELLMMSGVSCGFHKTRSHQSGSGHGGRK